MWCQNFLCLTMDHEHKLANGWPDEQRSVMLAPVQQHTALQSAYNANVKVVFLYWKQCERRGPDPWEIATRITHNDSDRCQAQQIWYRQGTCTAIKTVGHARPTLAVALNFRHHHHHHLRHCHRQFKINQNQKVNLYSASSIKNSQTRHLHISTLKQPCLKSTLELFPGNVTAS